jgi:hypothetical protein
MGCEQSLLNCHYFCNGSTLKTSKPECKSTRPSLNIIDQFEFDNTNSNSNGLSTNRELNTKRSNLSDIIFINTNLDEKNSATNPYNHKFFLNLEKIKVKSTKKNNFESDRSNTSNNLLCNNSEINDGIETTPHRRLGKSFISLIKEFNFIQKLFLKCQSQDTQEKENQNPNTDNKGYIHLNDYKNSEENNSPQKENEKNFTLHSLGNDSISLSCKSFNTMNSNFSDGKFQIKSTILKENKERTKYKDFFSKLKNLVFIPIVSLTGEVCNSFIIKKEIEHGGSGNYTSYTGSNYSKMKLESLSITLPLIDNVQTYFLNFLENFSSNLNNCRIKDSEDKKLNFHQNENEREDFSFSLQPLNLLFFSLKFLQVKNVKILIYLENFLFTENENEKNCSLIHFGIGVNKIPTEIHEDIVYLIKNLTFGENSCLGLEEIISLFYLSSFNSQIHDNGYVLTLQPKSIISENKIRNQISSMILMAKPETDLEEEMRYLDDLLSKNYSKLKSLKLRVIINSEGKMEIISLSVKREVKTNTSLGKEKISHYTDEFTKVKYEILNIKFGDILPDQYSISYEYQL